ncbi:EthD domain-containing protein [Mucilaginibacter sp. JRF]|uniref:EthD domain-containing protein n=1 Tax=Mucilaginibacter sp. JRF TaxID=2780088 RepID=UPI00187EA941|nr:EthD domain-containing protein [Mucilaginibacter sp. JRF]MBE9583363.1 EthD domain-containing protein [Mucilaginibacter sp. JRF]
MIKFSFLITRLPGMSLDAFVDHHKNKHAPLFSSIPETQQYVLRYVVSHPIIEPGFPEPSYDAMTDIYFDSFKDYHQFFSSENFLKTVQPDHANFFDESKVVMLVTKETTVI